MIISKTPLRVSFFGGGSDVPAYYNRKPGLVVSSTIDSFIYLAINRCVANHVKVIYSELEHVSSASDVKHDRVREALKLYQINSNIEICSFSDIPTKGTGLGSSSSFTVGLVKALEYLKRGGLIDPMAIADTAFEIENFRCGEPLGLQDQYAAAFEGFNEIRFDADNITVKPISLKPDTSEDLQNNLMFFNTGKCRSASIVLNQQIINTASGNKDEILDEMVDIAEYSIKLLHKGKIDDFGALLDDTWKLKKRLANNVSNPEIDEMYDIAKRYGALGGKILGAGNGGYLMVYALGDKRMGIIDAMKNYERRKFRFHGKQENGGIYAL
jgi:D-glycero-alpha-D-manno-heptose-7-phosphate kinase